MKYPLITKSSVSISPTHELASQKAAELFIDLGIKSLAAHGHYYVALTGGKTPEYLYNSLHEKLDDRNIHLFLGDERAVPLDDVQSNYRMIKESLLSGNDNEINIYPINAAKETLEQDAHKYEEKLLEVLPLNNFGVPVFDLILLGLGDDGHIASLFPDTDALLEMDKMVTSLYVEKYQSHRITITYPVINSARNIIFLVSGNKKNEIIKQIFATDNDTELPVTNISPSGKVYWFLDKEAATEL